jgi:hypothetical protein
MQTLGSYFTLFQGVQQRKIRRIHLADARILRFQQALHVAHSFDACALWFEPHGGNLLSQKRLFSATARKT